MSRQIKIGELLKAPYFLKEQNVLFSSDLKQKLRNVWKSTHDFLA